MMGKTARRRFKRWLKKSGQMDTHKWYCAQRAESWQRQNHRCKYCLSHISRSQITADHANPKSNGGTDENNIVAACEPCNTAKGSIPAKTFAQMLKGNKPAPHFRIYLCGVRYRLNRRTDKAVSNILAVA